MRGGRTSILTIGVVGGAIGTSATLVSSKATMKLTIITAKSVVKRRKRQINTHK
jgi:hypothetical protein